MFKYTKKWTHCQLREKSKETLKDITGSMLYHCLYNVVNITNAVIGHCP